MSRWRWPTWWNVRDQVYVHGFEVAEFPRRRVNGYWRLVYRGAPFDGTLGARTLYELWRKVEGLPWLTQPAPPPGADITADPTRGCVVCGRSALVRRSGQQLDRCGDCQLRLLRTAQWARQRFEARLAS